MSISRKKKREERAAQKTKRIEARVAAARERERAMEISARRRAERMARVVKKLRNRPAGFDYRNSGILPRAELEVTGDAAFVTDRLTAGGIKLSDIAVNGPKLRFKIRKKDLRKAIAILDEMCYNFKIVGTYGVGRSCGFLLARAGLLVGAALACIMLNILYSYIWRVEITGVDRLPVDAVMAALGDAGFVRGIKKRDVDTARVISALRRAGVSDAGAEVVGTTLRINILEAGELIDRQSYVAYTAAYDATVTRIVLRSGTAAVRVGDVVKCGDVLADGNVYSTAGELMYYGRCDADIYGNVAITVTAELSPLCVEYRRTGSEKKRTGVRVFGRELFDMSSPYDSYEVEAHTSAYDVLLPIYVTSYTYHQTEAVTIERDIDAMATDFAAQKVRELRFEGDFSYTYDVGRELSGLYRVNLFISGETLISRGCTAQ